jgi:tryptophan 2,3-dioxygenase
VTKSIENTQRKDPELSVVVAIIEGGRLAIEECLSALGRSSSGIRLECLIPYDARLEVDHKLLARFSWATFIDAREQVHVDEFGTASREHHDILRAIGLRKTSAPIVALLEDHAEPAEGWCRELLLAHRASGAAAIGGAVENGVDRLLNWAVYFCDFGRYQNPVPDGEVEFLSDSNVSYKRDALFSVQSQWSEAFHETSVNWELRRHGESLRLNPGMVVYQCRHELAIGACLVERIVWGRSFAGTRAADISTVQRLVFAMFSFMLPLILTLRIVSAVIKKRRHVREMLVALPLIIVFQVFWSLGELIGYVTGRAEARETVAGSVSHDVI